LHIKLKISTILKVFISAVLLFIISHNIIAQAAPESDVHLVLDSLNYDETIPNDFRKTTDLESIKNNKNLKLFGLDKLNISGSQQFSEYNLPSLIKKIGTSMPITVVDLRQESHGFINGIPVSWVDLKNNANAGLTREQVLLDEATKLKSIKLNEPVNFYNYPEKTIIPVQVKSEEELVKSKDLDYNRITVRDGGIPSDDMVDYFIELIKGESGTLWLHFHCKAGIGRTTMFMIMYDMIKNYKEVSAEEIINRQLALANFDETKAKAFYSKERAEFLNQFYDYCKANGDNFTVKWSEWKSKNDNKAYNYMIKRLRINFEENLNIGIGKGILPILFNFRIKILNLSKTIYQLYFTIN
jgi:protein-tyrosine phosphatase